MTLYEQAVLNYLNAKSNHAVKAELKFLKLIALNALKAK